MIWHVYLYDTNNMAGATAGAELTTRTVVVEIKYFCTKNVVIHSENCKLNLPLDCSTTQMEKNIGRMCGINESSRRRRFRNGRNVKWQGLIAINSLLASFITV